MRTTVIVSVALALATLATAPAPAADEDFARRGLYVGLAGLRAFSDFDATATSTSSFGTTTKVGLDSGDSWGVEGRIGYRFHEHVAAEAQLQYYDEFGLDLHAGAPINFNGHLATLDGVSGTGNVKFYPLNGRFQPYLLGGVGFLVLRTRDVLGVDVSDAEAAFAGRAGVGLDVYLTREFALYTEASALLPAGSLSAFRTIPVTFGGQYRF